MSGLKLFDYSRESLNRTSHTGCISINKNKEKLNIQNGLVVKHLDALEFLKTTDQKFDIIFVDPPYKEGYYEKVAPLLYNVLKGGGIAILESENELDINAVGLSVYDNRKYGRTRFTFLKKE